MNMRKDNYSLKEVIDILENFSKQNNFNDLEVIKWIIIKTLRLKRDQYDYIKSISNDNLESIKIYLKRYIDGESLGKIFGYIEFYGNYFNVTENVFDPRLSTEALITSILKIDRQKLSNATIIDLCTGSGCIAITLSKILNLKVDAVDISPFAIEIAKTNAKNLNADINLFEFDLNDDWAKMFAKKYDIIVSNPPYWNAQKILSNPTVTRDNPVIAFDGGEDGLKYIKIIVENAIKYLNDGGKLFLEIDPDQFENIKHMMLENGYKNIGFEKDHRDIIRVIFAEK